MAKRMYCLLATLMAQQNLSQRQLATRIGLSVTTINKLYNGSPLVARIAPSTVEKICDFFCCEIDELFVLIEDAEVVHGIKVDLSEDDFLGWGIVDK